MVLLSEGLPFLVGTIGFEKKILLTQAVLSAALKTRRPQNLRTPEQECGSISTKHVVHVAIMDRGYGIAIKYIIEICVLAVGAISGTTALQHFCSLAACILFFDCTLLFTFYIAILTIKLEANRIKRHVELRQALEDDGIGRRVAEEVARSDEWPKHDFGNFSVTKFKVLMVSGFIIISVLNIYTIPFQDVTSHFNRAPRHALSAQRDPETRGSPLMTDLKLVSEGLVSILEVAKYQSKSTIVTVLPPIEYKLGHPSANHGTPPKLLMNETSNDYVLAVGSLLKSLEDPVLTKCIIIALVLSVAFNGYLFNAARWAIGDPLQMPLHNAVTAAELEQAEKLNNASQTTSNLVDLSLQPFANLPPSTPALTDDGEDVPGLATTISNQPQDAMPRRSLPEIEHYLQAKLVHQLYDEDIIALSMRGKIPGYSLERAIKDTTRAVKIRRAIISRTRAIVETTNLLESSYLPYENYDFDRVLSACCENVIGYMPLPVGVAGPIIIDGQSFFLPMATTEGVLVASTSRRCKAINSGGGAVTESIGDGMTRGPCIGFETLERAGAAKNWLDSEEGKRIMTKAFDSTSRFARLQSIKTVLAGTYLYPRFKTTTGDAMGMNMISKGVEHALQVMAAEVGFADMHIVSVSGNFCSDKKAAAINWIDGRGKSVVAEAIIPGESIRKVLKTTVDTLVEPNVSKNLVGSAMAGSIGGFNAHAANIVAAIFIATGQDPAQVIESSHCITLMKK